MAYEVLSDSDKREMYDNFGLEAVTGEGSSRMGGMGGFPFGDSSIFSHIFGGDLFGGRKSGLVGDLF